MTARTRRATLAGVAATVIVALLMVMAGPASATWVQANTPTIGGERASSFGGVSCAQPTHCIAVGRYLDSSARQHILAESWDGTTWTVQSTSDPFGAFSSGLNAVACHTATSCVAVGSYVDSGGNTLPLADVWNGSSWTLWAGSLPNGAVGGVLTGVKCPSSSFCFAVGTSTDATGVTTALAEKWDTTSWQVTSVPTPSGATQSELDGIACPGLQLCFAVGGYRDAANNPFSLAEGWAGAGWSIQSTPNPGASGLNLLSGVACSSTTQCEAVGSGFAEGWNGSAWTLQTISTPHPHTGGAPTLFGVGCRPTFCMAVGSYDLAAVETRVAERWDGKRWALQSTPVSSPNDSSSLNAVSCTVSDVCMAAGSFHNSFFNQDHTLAEAFSLVWSQQTFTDPDPGASIAGSVDDLACPTATFCVAVGTVETSTGFESYAETWDGSQWTVTPLPNPSAANLTAVSCSSAIACTAVGNGGDAINGFVTLAERWDGTSWTVQTTPDHSGGGQGTFFTGVSCRTAGSCTAVGAYRDSSGNQLPFAANWDGTTWTDSKAVAPSGATLSSFSGVSCSSASFCVAVGSQGPGNPTALAEVWNGAIWTVRNPIFASGLTSASLQGVSCQSTTSCTAVGSVFSTPAQRRFALAEKWNGTGWTDEGAQVPPSTKTNVLSDVSCVTANNCMAVGSTVTSATTGTTLTETWDGSSWTLKQAANPGGPQSTRFAAVSCPSQFLCVGGGTFSGSNGNDTFLAEQYS